MIQWCSGPLKSWQRDDKIYLGGMRRFKRYQGKGRLVTKIGIGLDNELLINPGDIVDKYTVLLLKIAMIQEEDKKKFAREELARTLTLLDQIMSFTKVSTFSLFRMIGELLAINLEQWKSEDRVRTEHSWAAARDARACNARRVAKKNEINQLFGYPIEIKQYQERKVNESDSTTENPRKPKL